VCDVGVEGAGKGNRLGRGGGATLMAGGQRTCNWTSSKSMDQKKKENCGEAVDHNEKRKKTGF